MAGKQEVSEVVFLDRFVPSNLQEKLTMDKSTQCGLAPEMSKEQLLIEQIIKSKFIQQLLQLQENMEYSSVMQLNLINDLMDFAKMN